MTLKWKNTNFTDCNWTQTHNYLVDKGTLNHQTKLASVECSFMN